MQCLASNKAILRKEKWWKRKGARNRLLKTFPGLIFLSLCIFQSIQWTIACSAQDFLASHRSLEEIAQVDLKWGSLDANNESRAKYLEIIDCEGSNDGKWVVTLVEKYGNRRSEGRMPIPETQWLMGCNIESGETVLLSCDSSKAKIKDFEPYQLDGILLTLDENGSHSSSFVWLPSRNKVYSVDLPRDSGGLSLFDALQVLDINGETLDLQSMKVEKIFQTAQPLNENLVRVSRAFDDASCFLIRQCSIGTVLEHVSTKESKVTTVLTAEEIRSKLGIDNIARFTVKPVYSPNYLTIGLPLVVTTELEGSFVIHVHPDLSFSSSPMLDHNARDGEVPRQKNLRMTSDGNSFFGLMSHQHQPPTVFLYDMTKMQYVPTNLLVWMLAFENNDRQVGCNHHAVFQIDPLKPHQHRMILDFEQIRR